MRQSKPDIRSNRVALVAFCLLCQAYQAEGIVRHHRASVRPVIDVLLENDVNRIQLPCPETLYSGLKRSPLGFKSYDTPDFRQHCEKLAEGVLQTAKMIVEAGLHVAVVVGVEFSPSCAVRYQFAGRLVKRKGIFMEILQGAFSEVGLDVPLLGATRHGPKPAVRKLQELLVG